jgi:methyltransferase (TIGR00027 family)
MIAAMQPGQPSHTAFRAAAHRAAHQVLEGGRIFADPLATVVLGQTPAAVFGDTIERPATRGMRRFIAARSRFAEESLAAAVTRGVQQYVVLGAGLDTFAHRNPFADRGLRVFEVDHPATQGWKRARLASAGLTPPASLTFAPVDFERQTLAEGLAAAGFDATEPASFAWLGVVVYLTRAAVLETLGYIGSLPAGTEVVFDYGEPSASLSPEQRRRRARREARLAAKGEPWITRFMPSDLAAELQRLGFDALEDLGPAQVARRFYGVDGGEKSGGHFMRAGRMQP